MTSSLSSEKVELVHLRRFVASLDNMRHTNAMTDVILVCGEQEFPAHRLVLAAASPYFQSLFRSEWKDANCERYDLPGWSAATAAAVLSFVYTGQLTDGSIVDNKDAMTNLLEAADYFQIDDLVEYCFKVISDTSLTTTNFKEMYILAEKFSNEHQISCIEELLSPNLSEATESEDFLHLDKCHLQNILQHPDVDHCCMEEVVTALLKWNEVDNSRQLFLKDLLNILQLYWCPVLLNDLLLENASNNSLNSATKQLLSEIPGTECSPISCHQLTTDHLKLVCFRDDMVHAYDTAKDCWLPTKQLPFDVDHRAATVVYHRHIFFFGGDTAIQFVNFKPTTVVQYCPFTNAVVDRFSGELLFMINYAGAGVFNDSIYVINGQANESESVKMVQRYDPNTKTCCKVASTLKHHYRPLVFSYDNSLFVFGSSPYNDKSLERYDPVMDQWTEVIAVTGIPAFTECYHSAFGGTKLYCLSQLNTSYEFYTFDFASEEIDIAHFNGGPDAIDALWSIQQNKKTILVAMDHHNAPYFYDVEAQLWIAKGQANDYMLCHHLSRFI